MKRKLKAAKCQCGQPILRWVHNPLKCGELVDDPVEIALMELSEFGWSSIKPNGEYRSQEELSGLLVQAAEIARKGLEALYAQRPRKGFGGGRPKI